VCYARQDEVTTIGNEYVEVSFDNIFGRILQIRNKKTQTNLIGEPLLADNFRILAPMPNWNNPWTLGKMANYCLGRNQHLSEIKIDSNKEYSSVILRYNGLEFINGKLDINIVFIAKVRNDSNEIIFNIEVENNSENIVEEVWFPVICGLKGVGKPEETELILPERRVMNPFANLPETGVSWEHGCISFHRWYPGYGMSMQWIDFNSGSQGLYIASYDKSCTLTGFHMEKYPEEGLGLYALVNMPKAEGLHVSINKFPYLRPGNKWKSAEAIVSPHCGDWHIAADKYRAWALTWMKFPEHPKWIMDEFMGWQTIEACTSAGIVYYKYKDFPRLCNEGKIGGVNTIDIAGWSNPFWIYPDYEPSQKLGGPDELRKALIELHKSGGRAVFWGSVNRTNMASDWYKHELEKYTVKNSQGVTLCMHWGHDVLGFSGQTMGYGQGAYVAEVCTWVEKWQNIIVDQIAKRFTDLGVDGVQMDEICGSHSLCYDPTHGHNVPGEACTIGTLRLAERLRREAKNRNPEFAMTGEECWDSLMQYVDINFSRRIGEGAHEIYRYTFPEFITTLAVGFERTLNKSFDRLNKAVMMGYFPTFEIGGGRETLEYVPEIASYNKELTELRKKFPEYLIHGRFLDTLKADIVGDVKYGIQQGPKGYAAVLWNDEDEEKGADVSIPELQGKKISITVSKPYENTTKTKTLPARVTVKPHRIAIVLIETKS